MQDIRKIQLGIVNALINLSLVLLQILLFSLWASTDMDALFLALNCQH